VFKNLKRGEESRKLKRILCKIGSFQKGTENENNFEECITIQSKSGIIEKIIPNL